MTCCILGLNFHHSDSSACLVINGRLVAAISEERLTRNKRDSAFPINAIKLVLKIANLEYRDIDFIAYSRNERANFIKKLQYGINNFNTAFPALKENRRRRKKNINLEKKRANLLGSKSNLKRKVVKVEHHLAHACSAYFNSKFGESIVFNSDGSGDFVSMSVYKGEENTLKLLDKTYLPNSLGMFYTAMTQLIGFPGYGDEFKLMGLSAYGKPTFYEQLKNIFIENDQGKISLQKGFINMHSGGISGQKSNNNELIIAKMYTKKLEKLLGKAPLNCDKPNDREMNIAASAQKLFEELTLNKLKKFTNYSNNICLAGGCSLNGLVNTKISEDLGFKNQFVQPASTDDGTAIGAAFFVWNLLLGNKDRYYMENCFLGQEYALSDREINEINNKGFHIVEHKNLASCINSAALSIASNEVIGWFQGRSEWGPRALGNRSILTNPANPNAKELINSKIKRRESYRPFAPSVLDSYVNNYFVENISSPFMNHVVKVKIEYRNILKAITHIDGSARIQTVTKEFNPTYYKLISKVYQYTKFPIVLNTSFNENEPIVEKPLEAFSTFERTNMDRVYIGKKKKKRYSD